VIQDTWIKPYLHLSTLDGRAQFSTWLTCIAINSSLMILRRKRSHREPSMETAGGDTWQQFDISSINAHVARNDSAQMPNRQCAHRVRWDLHKFAFRTYHRQPGRNSRMGLCPGWRQTRHRRVLVTKIDAFGRGPSRLTLTRHSPIADRSTSDRLRLDLYKRRL
jgi:Sigma-70 region 2